MQDPIAIAADTHHSSPGMRAAALEACADYGEPITYALVPAPEQVQPADVDSSELALEVVVVWGELSVLHVAHLSPPRAFSVGDAGLSSDEGTPDFVIGTETLGTERLPITVETGAGLAVVIPAGARGNVSLDGESVSLADLHAQGRLFASNALAGARQYPLQPGAVARIFHRGFTFIVKTTSAAKRVGVGEAPRLSWRSWTLASFALHALLVGMFYFAPPRSSALALDLLRLDSRNARYLIEPVETQQVELPTWVEPAVPGGKSGTGKRHDGDEGTLGDQKAEHTQRRYGIEGPKDNPDPHMARADANDVIEQASIVRFLRESAAHWNAPTSPYGRDTALGNDPASAIGAITGDMIGQNFGFGGLGARGTGRGGGGPGEGTIGTGNLGTLGHGGANGSDSGYAAVTGSFHVHHARVPRIRSGTPDVHGSLSKEVIRRIIHRHGNEIRFCYQQALTSRPDLQGRVVVKFIIAPTGSVQAAAVATSELGHGGTEQCITAAVKRWIFPAPDGGGVVVVTYPFVFEQAGG